MVLRHRGFMQPAALLDEAPTRPPLAAATTEHGEALDDDALATVGPWIAWQLDATWDDRLGSFGGHAEAVAG